MRIIDSSLNFILCSFISTFVKKYCISLLLCVADFYVYDIVYNISIYRILRGIFLLKYFDFLSNAKIRVLVIDDTQKNLEVVGQLLSDNNYHVTVANSGERGIAIARKLLPDLILLDIMMPDINGYEVCKRLKSDAITSAIPVVFLTAKTDSDGLIEGFRAGAVDYVTKPFVKDELLARVNTHSELSRKRRQEQMLAGVLDKYVLEIIIDITGVIRYVSGAFMNLTEYEEADILGKSFDILKHPDSFRSELSDILDSIKNNYIYFKEIKIRTKTNKLCILNTFVEPIVSTEGKVTGAQCFMVDVTSRKALEHLSITDKLTDLFNRQKLDEVLHYEYTQSVRYGSRFSIILLDIDDFKNVNDTLGHLVGDKALVKFADILRENIRDSDTVGRWGGEEFLIILPKAQEDEAVLVAEKLRKNIEQTDFEINMKITASIGVSSTAGKETLTNILSQADKALYKAKKLGKNKVLKASDL